MKKEQELLYLMVHQKINANKEYIDRIQALSMEIDINVFLNLVKQNKCIPLIQDYIEIFDENYKIILEKEYEIWINRVDILEKLNKDISKTAQEENITIIEPKGFALAQKIYNNKVKRQFSDLDLIVPASQMQKLGKILVEKGFFHRHNGKIEDICAVLERNINTLAYEVKFLKQTIVGIMIVELKKASDAVSYFNLPYFTKDLEVLYIDGQELHFTFSNEGLLLHLCSNIYTDHYKYEGVFSNVGKFRNYLDLYYFCRNVKYDHAKFYNLAKNTNLEKSVEFCKVIMKELFSVDIFSEFKLKNTNISNFPEANTIIYKRKKHFFWELYRKKQIEKNNREKKQNTFTFKKVDVMVYKNQKSSKISFAVRANSKELDNILNEKRLFIAFISGLSKKECNISEEKIDANSYYSDNYTFCIFKNSNGIQFTANRIDMFSVYNQNTSNERIKGEKILGLTNNDQFKWNFIFDIPEYFYSNDIYINLFTDIKLLDDYYKHDQYLFALGEPFAQIE